MWFWANRQVLVTGGSGSIGSHLVEFLLEQHAKIRTAARLKCDQEPLENLNFFSQIRKPVVFGQGVSSCSP